MTQPKQLQNWTSDETIYILRTLTDLRSHYNSLIDTNYKGNYFVFNEPILWG
jgi:hypothetical protein